MTDEEQKQLTGLKGWFYKIVEYVAWVSRVIFSASDRFYWDNGFSKSASLAYTSLFSLVPCVTLIFVVLASFYISPEDIEKIEQIIIQQLVPAEGVAEKLHEFLSNVGKNVTSFQLPILAFFIVSSILLINAIEYALNETWQVFEVRTWAQRIGVFSTMILIAPILLFAVYMFIKGRVEPLLEGMDSSSLNSLYTYVTPIFLTLVSFFGMYYLVPKAPVKVKSAIFGAIFSAVVFYAAYWGFAIYIEHSATYEKLYGTIAAIPIFLFWLYIFWTIVLLGAEVCYQAQYLPKSGKLWKRSVHSIGDGRILLAMQALVIICKSFVSGEKMPDYLEIAERLGCSSVVLKPTLDTLAHAGLISTGDSGEKRYTLMRSPEKITLAEIESVLFMGRTKVKYPAEMKKVFTAFCSVEDTKNLTLLDILATQT